MYKKMKNVLLQRNVVNFARPQKTHKLIPLLYITDTYLSIPLPFLGQEMTYLAIPWQS